MLVKAGGALAQDAASGLAGEPCALARSHALRGAEEQTPRDY